MASKASGTEHRWFWAGELRLRTAADVAAERRTTRKSGWRRRAVEPRTAQPTGEALRPALALPPGAGCLFGRALRNSVLEATSADLALSSGSFDSSGLVFAFPQNPTASLDYRATGFISTSGSEELEGLSTNKVATSATLLTTNGRLTVTIPVGAEFFFTLLTPDDVK